MTQFTFRIKLVRLLSSILCVLFVSSCSSNIASNILYDSAVSKLKFDCENDKIGNSIEQCKRDIDANIHDVQTSQRRANKNGDATGYEPKDFVKKQLNPTTRSTQ